MSTTHAVGVEQAADVTADYTADPKERQLRVYSSQGPITITLPTAGLGMTYGYRIIDADGQSESNNITVQTENGEPINRGGSDVSPVTLAQNSGIWFFDPQQQADGDVSEWAFGIVVQDHNQLQGVTEGQHRSQEQVEDIVGGLIEAATGSNVSVSYDDGGDTLTIDTSALNTEEVEDAVNALLSAGSGINLNYDDGGDTLTVSVPEDGIGNTELDNADHRDFDSISTPADPGADVTRTWAETEADHTTLHVKDDTGIDFQLLRDSVRRVRNTTGSTLNKGDVVYVTGSNGNYPTVAAAKADAGATMPAAFMLAEDIANNDWGLAFSEGQLESIDVSSFSEGDELFVSPSTAGALTATEPSGTDQRQHVGTVVKDTASGSIEVKIRFAFDPSRDYTWTGAQKFGTDIQDDAGTTIWDNTNKELAGELVAPKTASLDSASTTTYTTNDEDEIRLDPSSAEQTVTLDSDDAYDGNEIAIRDVGHAAGTNKITVNTEGNEEFADGDTSKEITHDGGWLIVQWDNTFTAWVTNRHQQVETFATDQLTINQVAGRGGPNSDQNIADDTLTQVNIDTADIEDTEVVTVDTTNDKITIDVAGTYAISGMVRWEGSANWSTGDEILLILRDDTDSDNIAHDWGQHGGANARQSLYVETVQEFSANDDVIMQVRNGSGSQETITGSTDQTALSVWSVG